MELVITLLGGQCPVQAEGTIDGIPFYFRARGARWSFSVGPFSNRTPDWVHEEDFGTGFDAGWMTPEEAVEAIERAGRAYAGTQVRLRLAEEAAASLENFETGAADTPKGKGV